MPDPTQQPVVEQSAVDQQNGELIDKVEKSVTHKALLGNQGLILYFRIVLQDMPLAGLPTLLVDEHRAAIEKLVERSSTHDIKIFSITGHTSEPGDDTYNLNLSVRRVDEVFKHLRLLVDNNPLFTDDSLYTNIKKKGLGEEQLAVDMEDDSDNPLNRRVEISYRMKIIFPQPPGGLVPRSRYWKIDFAAAAGLGTGTGTGLGSGPGPGNGKNNRFAIGAEFGVGSLTMLPDGESDQFLTIKKQLTYESLGVSVGFLALLKKAKLLTKIPQIKRLLRVLDSKLPGNYKKTENLIKNAGFSVDLVSQGGEFETGEALSFAEMAHFNFSTVSGNVSFGASGTGSLVMLHSGHFFASTVIYGAGMNIAFPDVALNFVPAAWVQVQTGT